MPELRYLIAQGPRHGTSHRACGVYPNRPAADPGISFSWLRESYVFVTGSC